MGSRAIYAVIEIGTAVHFYTQLGGNEHTPFAALKAAEKIYKGNGTRQPLTDIMPTMTYGLLYDTGAEGIAGYEMFERLTERRAETMLSDFGRVAAVGMHITFDLDRDAMTFAYNPLCYHPPVPENFSMNIQDGLNSYDEVIAEAVRSGKTVLHDSDNGIASRLQDIPAADDGQKLSL